MSATPRPPTLPAPLRDHMGQPLLVAHLGVMGGRTLLLTDHPAIYIHDSGGLLNPERVTRIVPYPLDAEEVVFADRSRAVRGRLKVSGLGVVAFDQPLHVERVADGLGCDARLPERRTPLPISVRCAFDADALAMATAEVTSAFGQARMEHQRGGELYAHIEVVSSPEGSPRLRLTKRGEALCDLPIQPLQPRREGRCIRLTSHVEVAGVPSQGLELHLPSDPLADSVWDAVQPVADSTEAAHAIAQVSVRGASDDAEVWRSEAVLDAEGLTLGLPGGKPHGFRFADPALRVSGTAERLVLLDGTLGPVALEGADSELVQRLSAHPGLRDAAARTLTGTRFPCVLAETGRPVVVEVGVGQTAQLRGASPLPADGWTHVERDVERNDALVLMHPEARASIASTLELLDALQTRLHACRAQVTFRGRTPDLLRSIVALEGDYLLYTMVGPVVELHGILGSMGRPDLHRPLQMPATEDFGGLAQDLVRGAAEVERHLERVAFSLPSFLTRCDGALAAPEERPPASLKLLEARYRHALAPLRVLAAKAAAVHEPLRPALVAMGLSASADFRGAALSTLAGAMVNPIFLLAGAQQAWAAHRNAGRVAQDRLDAGRRATERALQRWNDLVLSLLPAVVQHVLDAVFPLRWRVGQELSAVQDDGLPVRLAHRLARLDAFVGLPPSTAVRHVRRDIIDALKACMAEVGEHDGFHTF